VLKTSFKIVATKVVQVKQTVTKSRAETLLVLWAFAVCFRMNFTFTFNFTARPTVAVPFLRKSPPSDTASFVYVLGVVKLRHVT
jgi:hypothetical protein